VPTGKGSVWQRPLLVNRWLSTGYMRSSIRPANLPVQPANLPYNQ